MLLQICVSCCDSMYCNEAVPTNHTNAVFSATITPPPPHQTSPSSAATAVASSAESASANRRTLFTRGWRWGSWAMLLASVVALWKSGREWKIVLEWLTNSCDGHRGLNRKMVANQRKLKNMIWNECFYFLGKISVLHWQNIFLLFLFVLVLLPQ